MHGSSQEYIFFYMEDDRCIEDDIYQPPLGKNGARQPIPRVERGIFALQEQRLNHLATWAVKNKIRFRPQQIYEIYCVRGRVTSGPVVAVAHVT